MSGHTPHKEDIRSDHVWTYNS